MINPSPVLPNQFHLSAEQMAFGELEVELATTTKFNKKLNRKVFQLSKGDISTFNNHV